MRDVYIGPIKAVLDFLDNSTMDFILCVSKDNLSKPLPSNVIQLDFGDTVDTDDPAAFSAQLAAEVASFLRRPDARPKLFVCCDCGVSRSAALAAAIRCADGEPHFHNPDLAIWLDPNYMPNPLVYRLTRQALDAPITEDALNTRLTLNATARRKVFSRNTTQTGAAEAKEDCYDKWVQEDIGKAKCNGGIVTTYPVDLGKYCWQVGNIFVFFNPYSPAHTPQTCRPIGRLHPDERRLELISPGHVDKIQKKDFDFVYIPATESRIPENIFEPGIIIETPIWSYARYYAEQHGIPVHAYLCDDEDFVPYGEYKSIKDVLEKQTFQCVKKITIDPKLLWREIYAFLNACSNVDEYRIVGDSDNGPLRVRLGVLHGRWGLDLYRIPPKLKGDLALLPGVALLQPHAFFQSELSHILLPDTICSIKGRVFTECPNLEELSLPASVISIGNQRDLDSPVADCPKLQTITVDPANPKYFSIDGVLYCKENGYLLTYPTGKSGPFDTPDFVLEYASDAFCGCRNLTSIRLGANVTRIGNGAFVGCTSLTELHLHAQIEQLDLFALSGCTKLKDIYIDNPALDILFTDDAAILNFRKQTFFSDNDTLIDCTALIELHLQAQVKPVDLLAITGCTDLKDIYVDDPSLDILLVDDESFLRYCKKRFLHTFNQGHLTIHAPAESTAANFAEQCALKFEPMYNGQRKQIELVCSNDVMDAIIDKFGKDVTVLENDMQSFRAVVNTAVGHVFYSWVFGFAGKVTIKSPDDVKKSYATMVKQAAQSLIE